MDIKTGNRSERLCCGPHFGSLTPVNPEKSVVFDFLPSIMLPRVSNLDDFVAAKLFDKWVSNADTRQAIFYRPGKRKEFRALMIDHGRIFSGDSWQLQDFAHGRPYFDQAVYRTGLAPQKVAASVARMEGISREDLEEIVRSIPNEWIGNDCAALNALILRLLERKGRLAELAQS